MSIRAGINRFLRWTAAEQHLQGRRAWILFGLMAAGAALRLQQWLFCRSLWLDEAALAGNLRNRSFLELLLPLDGNQGAGIGFLWVQKALVSVFSDHEMVLRVLLLLAGIAALVLFARLAFTVLSGWAPFIALAFFAVSERQIYYANEAKQYGLDVFWALLLLVLAVQLLHSAQKARGLWPLGLLGFAAVWFSHPAVFVLAGTGMVLVWARWRKALPVSWPRLVAVGALWCVSFLLAYWVSLCALMANARLMDYWQSAFLPCSWPEGLYWLGRTIWEFFFDPVSLVPGLALPLFIFGAVILGRRSGKYLALLLLPALVTLVAAVLHKYPFQRRLVLFLAPAALLLVSESLGALGRAGARRLGRYRWLVWAAVGLLAVGTTWDSLRLTARRVVDPQVREHIRPLFLQVKQDWLPGDRLYVYRHSREPFRYYRERLDLGGLDWIQGRGNHRHADLFEEDLRSLADARRVWVLISHAKRAPLGGSPSEAAYILKLFGRLGPRRWHRGIPGSSLTLFSVER
jgi:hypothetical protein